MKFGELLKLWMSVKEITVRELAKDIDGISSSTISRICNGECVDAETLITLIQYFFRAR